jgi:hypothetical protein
MIAYGPIEKPEVAIACGAPDAYSGIWVYENLCQRVVKDILQSYFSGR